VTKWITEKLCWWKCCNQGEICEFFSSFAYKWKKVCNMAATNNLLNNNNNSTRNNGQSSTRRRNTTGALSKLSCSRCCGDFFAFLQRFRTSPEEVEQRYKSREIDKFLEQDRRMYRRQVMDKLWTLGICTIIRFSIVFASNFPLWTSCPIFLGKSW
jgi:hypothetical protein